MAVIKYRDALKLAIKEEMERDPLVFCLGEGIGERGGSYKVTDQLYKEFGLTGLSIRPLQKPHSRAWQSARRLSAHALW